MNRMVVFLNAVFLFIPVVLIGQTNMRGRVTDAQTGEPLSGANIQVLSTSLQANTDSHGLFELKLPGQKAQIKVTFVGYAAEIKWVTADEGKRLVNITLSPGPISTDVVVVTATRTAKRVTQVPGRTEWLSSKQLEAIPVCQADEYLRAIPGLLVSREHGSLDHRSTVSMRGLGGDQQGRYLVLLDGVPMNKADGGSVNWNSINTDDISKIEVAKGPGSSLYGGNAMGGVINYIRKIPNTPLEGSAHLEYGDMNSMKSALSIGGKCGSKNQGFYWNAQGFSAKSDGYNETPVENRDSTTIANNLKEYGAGARLGYLFKNNHKIEYNLGYWWDQRGSGTKIYAKDGTYFSHSTLNHSLKYSGGTNQTTWSVLGYYSGEDYSRLTEALKKNVYTSYSVTSRRNDGGIQLHADHRLAWNLLSLGGEWKQGSVFGQDIYTTSTDTVTNEGKITNLAVYLQDQITLLPEHLFVVAGLRWDHSTFYDGGFYIASPTSATSILTKFQELNLDKSNWSEFSPKLALQYSNGKGLSGYLSYGHGFRPSVLDDMCRSGFINGGFKRANPYLQPERLNNFELGGDLQLWQKAKWSLSAYYSFGQDFIYQVSTGDSVLQGKNLKPLKEARNISGVEVKGIESSWKIDFRKGISGYVNYVFTKAEITDYEPEFGATDLKGKNLIYVPEHQISGGLIWRNRWVNVSIQTSWLSEQWMDDLNTISIPSYLRLDARIWTDIAGFNIFINGQNLTNKVYLEGYGQLSLGRYWSTGIGYRF